MRTRRAFSLLEVIIATVVLLGMIYGVVLMGQYFLTGFVSGEQKYTELREAVLLNNALRTDIEGLVLDPARDDLGVQVTDSSLAFTRMQNGVSEPVRYDYDQAQAVVRRRIGSESPSNLGVGVVMKCRFSVEARCRDTAGVLVACPAKAPVTPIKRFFVGVELSIATSTPNQVASWLNFRTHFFPAWANRRLASVWNRS